MLEQTNLQVSCVVPWEEQTSFSKRSISDDAKGSSASLPVAKSLSVEPDVRCQYIDHWASQEKESNEEF